MLPTSVPHLPHLIPRLLTQAAALLCLFLLSLALQLSTSLRRRGGLGLLLLATALSSGMVQKGLQVHASSCESRPSMCPQAELLELRRCAPEALQRAQDGTKQACTQTSKKQAGC